MKYLVAVLLLPAFVFSQAYLQKQGNTRHRFAQSVFGLDMQTSVGGHSYYVADNGAIQAFNFGAHTNPRIYIAGTHFWGHAEFYFSFPIPITAHYKDISYKLSQSDVFGTKIYPWAIEKKKLRPYLGFSVSGINYRQSASGGNSNGPKVTRLKLPLLAGVNYCSGKYLFELGLSYNYDNTLPYYIVPGNGITARIAPLTFNLSVKRWLETTVPMEKSYLDGTTEEHFLALKKQHKLSSWFVGIGPSSAFYTGSFSYNKTFMPYMDKPFATIFPEVSLGYYYQPFGIHIVSAGRSNKAVMKAYGNQQTFKRSSISAECFKYLLDYQGFNPYAGLCFSYEWLGFRQQGTNSETISINKNQFAPGIILGWDILPDKLQGIMLRTNLRYFPNLALEPKSGSKVFLNQLEFNFIQLIVYPQRIKNIRNEWKS